MSVDKGKLIPGIEYQFEIITYIAACLSENLLKNKKVEDFQIYTNQKIPGFDDIIVKVKYESEKYPFVYLGQIRRYIQEKIDFNSGKDRLQQYLEKIWEIKENYNKEIFLEGLLRGVPESNIEFWFISNSFLSNYNCPTTNPLEYPIYLDDGTSCYLEPDTAYQTIFPLRNGMSCYKWITKSGQRLPSDLRKFYVFLRQLDHNQVANSIVNIYQKSISTATANNIINFVNVYLKQAGDAELTKHIFETHLLKLFLSDCIVSPTEAFEIDPRLAENWNKLVLEFDVTLVSSEMESYVFGCIWQEIRRLYPSFEFDWNQTLTNNNGIFEKTSIQEQFKQLVQNKGVRHSLYIPDTIMNLFIEMWKCDYLPLVLNTYTDITILKKYKHLRKKFVILHRKEKLYHQLSRFDLRIFANVADIPESDLPKEFLESLLISLQGREPVGLLSILNDDTDLMKEMKCDQLLYLMRERKNLQSSDKDEKARIKHEDGDDFYVKKDKVVSIIGKCLTNTEKYIERCLRKPTIETSILNSKRQLICLLSGDLNTIPRTLKNYYKFLDGRIEDIVSRIKRQIDQNQSAFIGIKDEVVEELWSRFSLREHLLLHIKVEYSKMVLLRYRNCPDITSYISYTEPPFKQESFFQETSTGITVLVGEPGSGKTTLLRSLFNACPKHCFALFCDLKNYEQDLREPNSELFDPNPINFILRKEEKQLMFSNFLNKFLEKTKELILFLDSFDEVLPGCKEQILKFIRILNKLNGRVIIASRLVTAHIIGESFKMRLLKIDTLSEEDIQKYLNSEQLSQTIFEQYPLEFQRNPLYLSFMITLYREDALPPVITPSSLLEAIIEKKIEHFYHDKKYVAMEYEYYREELLEIHQKLALVEIFGDYFVRKLHLNFEDLQKRCTYSGNLKSGLIVQFSKKGPIFSHRAIAEFLVAEWLSKNINKDIGKGMYTMLLDTNRIYARFLLDDILCRNLPLHRAVIRQDLDLVKRLCPEDGDYLKEVDKLNRTALEIAASYCSSIEIDDSEINRKILEEILHHMFIKEYDLSKRNMLIEMHWSDYVDRRFYLFFSESHFPHTFEMYYSYQSLISDGFTWSLQNGMLDISMKMLKKNLDLLPEYFDRFLYEIIKQMRVDLLSELIELRNSKNMEFDKLRRACKNSLPASEVSACTNLKIEGGFTAIHTACIYGSVDVVKELIRLGVEVNAVDDFQLQPLYYAIGNGSSEIVTILVKLFKKEDLPSSSSLSRIFPMYIHNSLRKSDIEIAEILLDNGFDINETDEQDITALHYAVNGRNRNNLGNCECFPVTDVYSYGSSRDSTDINIEEIKLLLKYKADCNIQDSWGETPLHIAIKNGRLDVTKILLRHGANINLHYRDGEYTALHYAVLNKSNELVKLLLQYGADVNLPNVDGKTALFNVRLNGYCDIAETLLNAGANVNHQDERGETALHVATEKGYNDVVKLMLQYGANVNSLNEKGETPLFYLISRSNEHSDIVETLINAGANVHHQNNIGNTVLIIATQNNNYQPMTMLLEKGANINHQNKYGNTALHHAVDNYYSQICKRIRDIDFSFKDRPEDIVNILLDALRRNNIFLSTLWLEIEILEMLLTGGADYRSEIDDTSLRTAADILKLLIDSGANVDAVNEDDLTALGISNKYKTAIRNYCKTEFKQYPLEFRENPLYLSFMITLDREDALPPDVTPSSLFNAIIDKQIKHFYHDEKLTEEEFKFKREEHLDIYKKLALVEIFGDFVVDELHLDLEDLQKKCTYSGSLKSGLIVRFSEKRPIFFHRTIAEYLVAEWLIENINTDIGKRMYSKLSRVYEEHIHLLNDILCRNLALHQAVIRQDLTSVKSLCSEDGDYLKQVDKLNRTALEVAASYCSSVGMDDTNYMILEEILHYMSIKGYDFSKRNPITEKHWTDYLKNDILKFGEKLKLTYTTEMYFYYQDIICDGFIWCIENGMLDTSMALLKKDLDLLPKHFDDFLYAVINKMRVDLLSELIELKNSNNMEFDILSRACKNSLPASEVSACTNLKTEGGFTAIHIACMYGSVDVVKQLVRLGVDVNAVDDFQLRPLYYAVIEGSTEIVTILVKLYKKENLPNDTSRQKINANYLHNSLIKNNLKIAKILLDHGFDIDARNECGETAFHIAVRNNKSREYKSPLVNQCNDGNNINQIRLLLRYNPNPNILNSSGKTPLHIAVENERFDITEMLLRRGANPNIKGQSSTPLHLASEKGNIELVKLLLSYRADINFANEKGETALFASLKDASSLQYDIVKALVNAGVNVNHQNNNGDTVLMIATKENYYKIVKMLLKAKAEIKLQNEDGNTALHIAVKTYFYQSFKKLCYDLNINIEVKYEVDDVLFNAIKRNDKLASMLLQNVEIIEKLLTSDANSRNEISQAHLPPDILRLLLDKGADVNAVNKDGKTALDIANKYKSVLES